MMITLTEYAKKNGKNPDNARQLISRGAIKSAVKVGRDWMIDSDEPWPDRRLKAKDVFTAEADGLTAAERRAILKMEQAKEYSGLRAYPGICSSVFDNIPDDMFVRYSARQLGEIAALLKNVYDKGVQYGRDHAE